MNERRDPPAGDGRADDQLQRRTLRHGDGRQLYVYGALHGDLPGDDVTPAPARLHQRLDLLTGAWVAVSPARNTRPQTGGDVAADGSAATDDRAGCPLCPGGAEVPFPYEAAVFENRFPSFTHAPPLVDDGGVVAPSFGRCEVVLYSDRHVGSLGTLPPSQVARVVAVWRDRSTQLWADQGHQHVLVFENRGEAVGATLSHPHGQIYAFDRIPPLVADRIAVLAEHRDRFRCCLSCAVVARDDAAPQRAVFANDSFTVAVPFAARWPFEVHVRARRHGLRRLGDLQDREATDLVAALSQVVRRYDGLFGFELPYMMTIQEAPADHDGRPVPDWHLAVEFLPPHRSASKLKIRASVETATGLFINDTVPEDSAAQLAALPVAAGTWDTVSVPHVVPAGRRSRR